MSSVEKENKIDKGNLILNIILTGLLIAVVTGIVWLVILNHKQNVEVNKITTKQEAIEHLSDDYEIKEVKIDSKQVSEDFWGSLSIKINCTLNDDKKVTYTISTSHNNLKKPFSLIAKPFDYTDKQLSNYLQVGEKYKFVIDSANQEVIGEAK